MKATPPLPGRTVTLRSFDVDDTTEADHDRGTVDSNGRAGGDNYQDYLGTPLAGQFVANNQQTYSTTLDGNGEALVEFRVGMQPGNNYRIAATVIPQNNLSSLQTETPSAEFFVSAYTDQIRGGFNGALSSVLTVWRKLHLEFDSMEQVADSGPEEDFWIRHIQTVEANQPKTGQTVVLLQLTLTPFENNVLENGSLAVGGSSFSIIGNYAKSLPASYGTYAEYVIVQGDVSPSAAGTTWDDDDYLLAEAGLPAALPKLSAVPTIVPKLQPLFTPTYIQIVDANAAGWNPRTILPFKLNEPVFTLYSSSFDDSMDLPDSPTFWSHLVSFGYQAEAFQDGDPEPEPPLYGGTPKGIVLDARFSVIYVEAVRELWASGNFPKVLPGISQNLEAAREIYWNLIAGDIVHETGHSPGGQSETDDHNEGGIMTESTIEAYSSSLGHLQNVINHYSPATIKRFRNAKSWSP